MKAEKNKYQADLMYVVGKLEEIHEDVRQLQVHVDELRQAEAGRKAVQKFVLGALGILGATVGWLVDNILTMAKGLKL